MLRVRGVCKRRGSDVAVVESFGLAAPELTLVAVGSTGYSRVPLTPDTRFLSNEKVHRQEAPQGRRLIKR